MILYDNEIELGDSFEFIDPDEFRTEDKPESYDLKEYQETMYNATYNAIIDAYHDIQKEKENEAAASLNKDASASPSPSPTPEPQRVIVENFPSSTSVDNFEDIDWHTMTDAILSVSAEDLVEFSTESDARLYTVSTSAPVSSATGQSAVYLLEIRNIVLIFCLMWLVIYVISMIKKVSKRHGKGGSNE